MHRIRYAITTREDLADGHLPSHMQAEMRGKTQNEIIHILTISLVVELNQYVLDQDP